MKPAPFIEISKRGREFNEKIKKSMLDAGYEIYNESFTTILFQSRDDAKRSKDE